MAYNHPKIMNTCIPTQFCLLKPMESSKLQNYNSFITSHTGQKVRVSRIHMLFLCFLLLNHFLSTSNHMISYLNTKWTCLEGIWAAFSHDFVSAHLSKTRENQAISTTNNKNNLKQANRSKFWSLPLDDHTFSLLDEILIPL